MSKRPKNSRRRQVPGTFRSHERQGADPTSEAQRIVLYLPIAVLDLAEQQSLLTRSETVQRYCESLLIRAIQNDQERHFNSATTNDGRLEELRTIADDPEYLAEWTAAIVEQLHDPGISESRKLPISPTEAQTDSEASDTIVEQSAAEVVLRHAGLLGDDPNGFLNCLRRGGHLSPQTGPELIRAVIELEAEHQGSRFLDRHLCYALHKIAFEGQVLVSEGGREVAIDEATVDLLRLLQEAVDRVLSGQDIRYYSEQHDPSSPTQP